MRLGFAKFTQPLSPAPSKPSKKPRSRLKSKYQVTLISNSLSLRKPPPNPDLSQILLTTRRNFITPYSSSRLPPSTSTQLSKLTKSLTKDTLLPTPSLHIKKKYTFFDNDKFHTERTLPMICKTNLREEIEIKQIQWTTPNIERNHYNPQEATTTLEPKFPGGQQGEGEMNSKELEPYTGFYAEPMNKILGNFPSDMIAKRFKALNNSLLRPEKMYYGRKFRSKDIVEWKH